MYRNNKQNKTAGVSETNFSQLFLRGSSEKNQAWRLANIVLIASATAPVFEQIAKISNALEVQKPNAVLSKQHLPAYKTHVVRNQANYFGEMTAILHV